MNKLNIVLIIFLLAVIFAKIATDPYLNFTNLLDTYAISLTDITLFVMLLFLDSYLLILAAKQTSPTSKVVIFMSALMISCLFIMVFNSM